MYPESVVKPNETEAVETVYMPLEDEGVDVWRPVAARRESDGSYTTVEQSQGREERWRFPIGTRVRCDMRTFEDGKTGLAAVESVEP